MIDSLRKLANEHHEIAAWLVLAGTAVAIYAGRAADINWPTVALVFVALVTLLGARRYRGLEVSKDGIGVEGKTGSGDGS